MTDIPDDKSESAESDSAADSMPPLAPPAKPVVDEAPASPSSSQFDGERIAKAIARAGIASRRDVEAMIEAGRVTLNGAVLDSPAVNVTDTDTITVDGEALPARERTRLWILHKPRGVVTTARDPEGRQTVFDVLPEDLPRVVAIGRLDINTEGLLLLTNDGGLAKVIAHPETGWLRRYRVRAFGEITQPVLDKLRKGVTIDGMEYGPVEATLDRAQGDNVWITLGLREGKNREVKRILEFLGLSVNRLIRLSFGPFQLGDLEVGLVEEIRTKVLKEQLGKTLSEQAGVDFESPVREPISPFGKPKKPARSGTDQKPPPAARKNAGRGPRAQQPGPTARERPGRDPARPTTPRVPTGGMGPGPRQSIWRAEDDSGEIRPHGTRIPRRGSDPKAARDGTADRERQRVGAIKTGDRRVLVERLQPNPVEPTAEPHRRVRFRSREESAPRSAEAGRETRREDRFEMRGPQREKTDYSGGRAGGGERHRAHRDDSRPREERAPRGDGPQRRERSFKSSGDQPGGFGKGKPGADRKGGRPGGFGGGGKPGPDRNAHGFDGKPGGRPRPGGAKPGGARPSGARPGGAKPGPRGQRPPPRGGH